jgi:hypothetical protein
MSDSSTAASRSSPASPVIRLIAAIVLLGVSATACLLGYLALAAPGPWIGGAPALRWNAQELTVRRGTAHLSPEGLVVSAPDALHTVVIALDTSFRARDYPLIGWDVAGVPDNVAATMLWYNDLDSSRVFRRSLTVDGGRLVPESVVQDRSWIGRISGLALVLQGSFGEPIVFHGAAAKPMSKPQVLGDRVHEWLAFEPWNGASINTLTGGANGQDLPLALLLAGAATLAALLYAGLARLKPLAFGPVLGGGLAAIFVMAWLAVDARWQWNLLRQARETLAQYAGKSWRERHVAAEDGLLFAFIEKVRGTLPAPPARVFVVAGENYLRDRAAYHLYPYNVYFDPWSDTLPPSSAVHSGDYLVVYQRKGVAYDVAQQKLGLDGVPPRDADLLLSDPGAALFRMR